MTSAFAYTVDMTPRLPDTATDAIHTVQRMIERNISWTDVLTVVAAPQKTVPGRLGRVNHYGVVNGRRIRVTIDASGAVWTVAVAGRTV